MSSIDTDASMLKYDDTAERSSSKMKKELNAEQIGYLVLMWTILGINVMLMTLVNAPFAHC